MSARHCVVCGDQAGEDRYCSKACENAAALDFAYELDTDEFVGGSTLLGDERRW